MKGSEFAASIASLPLGPEREQAIFDAVVTNNGRMIWPMIDVEAHVGEHVVIFTIAADYIAVGEPDDFLRVPMSPLTAQRIVDALDLRLPTTRMVDLAAAAALLRGRFIEPIFKPACPEMTSTRYFVEHNAQLEAKLAELGIGGSPDGLLRGLKKDVVRSNRLLERPNRLSLYGWHRPRPALFDPAAQRARDMLLSADVNTLAMKDLSLRMKVILAPVQPNTLAHENTYGDYSHGIAVCGPTVTVDGETMALDALLVDPVLCAALSAEGPLKVLAYPRPASGAMVGPFRRAAGPSLAMTQPQAVGMTGLRLVRARNFTAVPRSTPRPIDLVVIHTMESDRKPTTAEAVSAWFAGSSAPQASAHYCVDEDSIVQCVDERDVAWGAPGANKNGVHVELAGRAAQTDRDWSDDYSNAELELAAKLVADVCSRNSIPVAFVDAEGLLSGERGITTHVTITAAGRLAKERGQANDMTKNTHWDPGHSFPMDEFIANVSMFAEN